MCNVAKRQTGHHRDRGRRDVVTPDAYLVAQLTSLSEEAWSNTVVGHAQRAGWMVYLIPDAMWRRAFTKGIPQKNLGNRGFPDLVLVGHGKVLFRELKRHGGKLSPFQVIWRDALLENGADWDCWWPLDLDAKVIPELWGDRAPP
jgi:hypothetical protein